MSDADVDRNHDSAQAPEPGMEAAPNATSEGVDDADIDVVGVPGGGGRRVLRRHERSGVGPGAGEDDVVSVETSVQHDGDDEVTRHPTLRGTSSEERG